MSAAVRVGAAVPDGGDGAEEDEAAPSRVAMPLLLFLLTFVTTTAHGAEYVHGAPGEYFPFFDGLSYSVPLLLILVCHEFGHYIAARVHGVPASLPHFIPLPPSWGFGTMGAIIGMRGLTRDRRKLIDIGAAGPLAGLLVAIPVILYGVSLSQVGPVTAGGLQEGNSILYMTLKFIVKGAWLPDGHHDVFLHPTALAGWAGLLVTMINLLPVGQLDGGHIATAFFGNGYRRFARLVHRALPIGAVIVFLWAWRVLAAEAAGRVPRDEVLTLAGATAMPWVVWFVMLGVLSRFSRGMDHPPVEDRPLPRSRRTLFWIVVTAFILIFMPVPQRVTLGPTPAPPSAPMPPLGHGAPAAGQTMPESEP